MLLQQLYIETKSASQNDWRRMKCVFIFIKCRCEKRKPAGFELGGRYSSVIGDLFQFSATAEQVDAEHQLFTGRNPQLPVDIGIVFLCRIDADKGTLRDLVDIAALYVIL